MSTNKTFNKVQLDVKFTQATTRANLISEENISISFGKISKYFADLHSQAFTGYTHPTYEAHSSGLYKITVDGKGHVSAATAATKADIPTLDYLPNTTKYALSDSVGGSAKTADKLTNARTIAIGTGVTSTATSFDGSANITIPVTGIKEAYLTWGGKDFSSSFSPLDAALEPRLGANRLEMCPGSGIKIERTTDGGTTWTEVSTSSISNAQRSALFSSAGYTVPVSATSTAGMGSNAAKYMMRITLDTSVANVYTNLLKFILNISTSGCANCYVKLRIRTAANVSAGNDTWLTWDKTNKTWSSSPIEANTKCPISGWSGYNVINFTTFTTYGNQTSHYRNVQFIFGCSQNDSTYPGLSIINIQGYGGVAWSAPSNMARTGHLYSWNGVGDASFPSSVTATNFNGKLNTMTISGTNNGSYNLNNFLVTNDITAGDTNGQIKVKTTNLTIYTHPSHTAKTSGLYKITVDSLGHVSGTASVSPSDIPDLNYVPNTQAGVNAAINLLSTGSSTPTDADYYISQYVGGGTTTTTYHRRPMSALWSYVKGKADSVYLPIGHTYSLSIAADSGTNQLTLSASTKYKLTAGGSTFVFTTSPDTTYSAGNHLSLSSTTFSIASYCKRITDWNSATTNGWYMGYSVTNAPSTEWWFGRVIAHNNKYCMQEIWQFTRSTDGHKVPHKMRMFVNNVWGNWTDITVGTQVPENAVFTDTKVTQTLSSDANLYPMLMSTDTNSSTASAITSTSLRNNSIAANPSNGLISCAGRYIKYFAIQTGSSKQQKISFQTLFTWLKDTKKYIPDNKYCHIVLAITWSYADNDILQLQVGTSNYELQLAGTIIEFMGYATSYNEGMFRLLIHSSPTTSFTPTSGYTAFPVSTIAEYTCNGSAYAPTWKKIWNSHPSYTSKSSGLYKITVDGTGHVSATTAVVKADITALGIPGSDTKYGISGAYGANSNTWVTTITAGGTGTTSTVPTASTSAYGITKLYNGVDSTSTGLAATANAVKTAYDKANHTHPYLPKTTYEWNKEISFGNSGYLKIGSFPMYDTNITIDINATTSETYHGTVVIATQNVSTTSMGSLHKIHVYDDPTGDIAASLRIVWTSGSRNYDIYFIPQSWSKNFIHIRALGNYMDGATDICVSQTGTAPATTSGLEPVNILSVTSTGNGNAVTKVEIDSVGNLAVTKGTTFSTTDEKVKATKIAQSTAEAIYYPTLVSGAGTAGVGIFDSARINHTPGTTSVVGNTRLILGNATASGTANNEEGLLKLYSPGTSYHTLKGASTSSIVEHTLPTTGGTILNDVTTSFTQTLSSGTKIGTIKINGTSTDLYCQTNTNTDTKVTQSETTTANYRPIVFGATNSTDTSTLAATTTDQTYVSTLLYAQPKDGILYANRMYLKAPGSKGQLNLITSKYNVMLRNDDSNTYFLVTAQNDPTGTWTSARPLTINNSTGVCSINGNAASANALNLTHGNELNFSKLASNGHVWFGYRWNTGGTETSGGTTITTYKFGNANGAGGLAGLEATTSTFKSGNFGDQLIVERTGGANMAGITFKNTSGVLGYIAANTVDGDLYHYGATDTSTMKYTILDSHNYTSYPLPRNIKHIHTASGTEGTAGWVKIARITVTNLYANHPMTFTIAQRGLMQYRIHLVFVNNGSVAAAAISQFIIARDNSWTDTNNNPRAYIIKPSDGIFDLYIRKTEAYDHIFVVDFTKADSTEGDKYSVTWTNVHAADSAITGGTEAVKKLYLPTTTNYAASSSVGGAATTVTGTLTNPTSETSYAVPFHTNPTTGSKSLLNNNGISYVCKEGTASALGWGILLLGNNVNSGTAGNKYGIVRMYPQTGNYYGQIRPVATLTGTRTYQLPDASGNVILGTKGSTSFWGLIDGDASTANWIRATSNGFIPSAAASFFQTATSSLGTNTWYFKNSYIQYMKANRLILGAAKTADGAAKGQLKFFSGNASDATGTVTLECVNDSARTGDYTVKLPTWNGTIPIFEKLFEGASNTVSLSYSDIDEYDVFLITVANSNATSEQVTVTSLWISNVAGLHDMPLIWGGAPTSSGGACNVTSGWIQLSKNSGTTTFVVAHKPSVAQMTSSGWTISSPTYNLYIRKIFGLKAYKRT